TRWPGATCATSIRSWLARHLATSRQGVVPSSLHLRRTAVTSRAGRAVVAVLALLLLLFIVLPLVALVLRTTPATLLASLQQPPATDALRLSLETTAITLLVSLAVGTPAAYILARWSFPGKRVLDTLVDLPIVVPPAVAGLALFLAFGRFGLF